MPKLSHHSNEKQLTSWIVIFLSVIVCICFSFSYNHIGIKFQGAIMPTILTIFGWRLFFYSNEGKEPPHIHCVKGELECKFWLDEEAFDISESYSFGLSPRDNRQIRKIIFNHFDYILEQWRKFQEEK